MPGTISEHGAVLFATEEDASPYLGHMKLTPRLGIEMQVPIELALTAEVVKKHHAAGRCVAGAVTPSYGTIATTLTLETAISVRILSALPSSSIDICNKLATSIKPSC